VNESERTDGENPIVFALDFASLPEARRAADAVHRDVGMLKVGLELFIHAGPPAVAIGRDLSLPVFLDLKLHDIPETVDRAVARSAQFGVRFVTVHAGGGSTMLRRAVSRASSEGTGLQIAAVTVLTSFDVDDLGAIGVSVGVEAHARRLARLAHDAGVRSFVCSPRELRAMRAELGDDVTLIAPGIRGTASADDQKRTATASQAILDGADWLVVGRPIRDASDPVAAARSLALDACAARSSRRASAGVAHAG
jgi:orotidine-5'-phosphate decarboxylase